MTLPKGSIQILRKTKEEDSASFTDYTDIEIEEEQLSSATVSKRIKELLALEALEETPTRSESGRKTVGYEITERGEKIINITDEFESKLEEIK